MASISDPPVFRCAITSPRTGGAPVELIAHSTADALASFLRRRPDGDTPARVHRRRRLEAAHEAAVTRWITHRVQGWEDTPTSRRPLISARYVGSAVDPEFVCHRVSDV